MVLQQCVLKLNQISRKLSNAFVEESKPPEPPEPPKRKKNEETEQILRAYNSQMHLTILLKFGMWGVEGGGRLHYENNLSSTREHGATACVCVKIAF